jgi:hypothetical protein
MITWNIPDEREILLWQDTNEKQELALLWGKQSFLSKCVAILTACNSRFLLTELHFPIKITTYPTPQVQSVTLANHKQILHPISTNSSKGGRAHCIRNKKEGRLPAPCACYAGVPVHRSAEVNFTLPRQFSISVSSVVTLMVFGALISNNLGACLG